MNEKENPLLNHHLWPSCVVSTGKRVKKPLCLVFQSREGAVEWRGNGEITLQLMFQVTVGGSKGVVVVVVNGLKL